MASRRKKTDNKTGGKGRQTGSGRVTGQKQHKIQFDVTVRVSGTIKEDGNMSVGLGPLKRALAPLLMQLVRDGN